MFSLKTYLSSIIDLKLIITILLQNSVCKGGVSVRGEGTCLSACNGDTYLSVCKGGGAGKTST